jgi:flagellar FliJ protein
MKRFKFSLQAVHDFREMRRENAERELAQAAADLERANALLDEVLRARQTATQNYTEIISSRELNAPTMVSHTDYLGSLVRREREARAQIAAAERMVETKRQVLVEAKRESETTAKIREQQQQRHELDAARKEQNILDELAVASVSRRQRSNK